MDLRFPPEMDGFREEVRRFLTKHRDRYVGDSDFVGVPIAGLLDPDYVAARAALIPQVNGAVPAGRPTGAPPRDDGGTTDEFLPGVIETP